MATLAEAMAGNIHRLAARQQRGRHVQAPAQYQHSDVQRSPRTAGRYRNLQTGEEVSRRRHDRLIGRPFPLRTRTQARERYAGSQASSGSRASVTGAKSGTGRCTTKPTSTAMRWR